MNLSALRMPVSLVALAMLLAACGPGGHDAASPPDVGEPSSPAASAATSRQITLDPPLPPGQAYAFFRLAMSGDQMNQSRRPSRLEVVVRLGDRELQQDIASCMEPSLGSALGGGTERELEVALCDAEYWLVSEPGEVRVARVEDAVERETRARFELGDPALRATSPPER